MTSEESILSAPASAALPRRLGVATATSVVVANMIGTGIFTTTGLLLTQIESGWLVLLAWMVGGLIALAGALSYAELATMMPRAGGEYIFLREIYGRLPAFLTGWTSFFVGFSAPIAATGVAIASYLTAAAVIPQSWLAEKGVGAAVVLILTAIHYCGLKLGARVQNALTVLKLALLGGLVVGGLTVGRGSWSFLEAGSDFWVPGRWGQMGSAMLFIMFAYSGWNAASYISEEVRQPSRTLPRSLAIGTLLVMGIYLLVNLVFFYAAPPAEMTGQVAVGKVAAERLFGSEAGTGFALLVSAALLSSLSAYVLIGPRVYFAMARDGLFFRFAGKIHPRFETPGLSILAQGLCAVLLLLTGTFAELLQYIGFALGIFPWMAVAGVVWLRRQQPNRERPYRVWGYPLVPLFYLLAMGWILVVAFVNSPKTSLAAIATVAAGIPVYWLTVGRHRR